MEENQNAYQLINKVVLPGNMTKLASEEECIKTIRDPLRTIITHG
jgi:hypothetical protein